MTSTATQSRRSPTALQKTESVKQQLHVVNCATTTVAFTLTWSTNRKATKSRNRWLKMKQAKTPSAHLNISGLYRCLKTTLKKLQKRCGKRNGQTALLEITPKSSFNDHRMPSAFKEASSTTSSRKFSQAIAVSTNTFITSRKSLLHSVDVEKLKKRSNISCTTVTTTMRKEVLSLKPAKDTNNSFHCLSKTSQNSVTSGTSSRNLYWGPDGWKFVEIPDSSSHTTRKFLQNFPSSSLVVNLLSIF